MFLSTNIANVKLKINMTLGFSLSYYYLLEFLLRKKTNLPLEGMLLCSKGQGLFKDRWLQGSVLDLE
jgi:hypothetical protein